MDNLNIEILIFEKILKNIYTKFSLKEKPILIVSSDIVMKLAYRGIRFNYE